MVRYERQVSRCLYDVILYPQKKKIGLLSLRIAKFLMEWNLFYYYYLLCLYLFRLLIIYIYFTVKGKEGGNLNIYSIFIF